LTTLGLISFVTIVAIILQVCLPNTDSLGAVVNITGGLAGSVVYFLVPGLCGLKLFAEEMRTYRIAQVVVGFGALIIVLVLVSSAL